MLLGDRTRTSACSNAGIELEHRSAIANVQKSKKTRRCPSGSHPRLPTPGRVRVGTCASRTAPRCDAARRRSAASPAQSRGIRAAARSRRNAPWAETSGIRAAARTGAGCRISIGCGWDVAGRHTRRHVTWRPVTAVPTRMGRIRRRSEDFAIQLAAGRKRGASHATAIVRRGGSVGCGRVQVDAAAQRDAGHAEAIIWRGLRGPAPMQRCSCRALFPDEGLPIQDVHTILQSKKLAAHHRTEYGRARDLRESAMTLARLRPTVMISKRSPNF
jgi:hypothetical protein